MIKLDDSIYIAASNKVKRKYFQNQVKFTSIYDTILFVMEVVEEYSFLNVAEKEHLALEIFNNLDLPESPPMMLSIHEESIKNFMTFICKATKKKIEINQKRKLLKCFF